MTEIHTDKMELIKCDKKKHVSIFVIIQRILCYEHNQNKHKNETKNKKKQRKSIDSVDRDHLPETESVISSMLSSMALNCTSD